MSVYKVINGAGKPRLILIQKSDFYTSIYGTTFDATSVTEAEGASTNITSSSVANPTTITTATAHNRGVNDWIRIAGHSGSTPSLNGKYQVLKVPSATTLQIGVNVTVGGTGGTLRHTPAFAARGFAVDRRIVVVPASASSEGEKYGKIVSVDDANNKLVIDSWRGGTPANGLTMKCNGWIADLPYCKKLIEHFDPVGLQQRLWRFRKISKHYGFEYKATLDYSNGIMGDTLLLLRPHLSMGKEDRLVLIPHVDAPQFQYNVFFAEGFDLAQYGQGLGYIDPVFIFEAKELVASFPMLSGYGTNHGNDFGNCL